MTQLAVSPAAVADTAAAVGVDPVTLADMLRVANSPRFERWQEQVRRTGGCANPIHLSGFSRTVDTRTGEFFEYSTSDEPGGRLRIACGNRRASRCPSCAWTYAGDTYHLIMAGLVGGKGIPATVAERPRVFATLTAPSFGPVHNRPASGRCLCGTAHMEDDPALGTALDPERYDYASAVLWNNHAGALWQRFTIYLRREVAARAGLTQLRFGTMPGSRSGRWRSSRSAGRSTSTPSFVSTDQRGPSLRLRPGPRSHSLTTRSALLPRGPRFRWLLPAASRPDAALGNATRCAANRQSGRPGRRHRACRGRVRRQVRHQGSGDDRHTGSSYRGAEGTGRPPRTAGAHPASNRGLLGPGRGLSGTAAGPLVSHARFPGPLLDQDASVLDHARSSARRTGRLACPARTPGEGLARPRPGRRHSRGHDPGARALGVRRAGPHPGESWLAASIAQDLKDNRDIGREMRAELEAEGEW